MIKINVHNEFEAKTLIKEWNDSGRHFEYENGIEFYSHAGNKICEYFFNHYTVTLERAIERKGI